MKNNLFVSTLGLALCLSVKSSATDLSSMTNAFKQVHEDSPSQKIILASSENESESGTLTQNDSSSGNQIAEAVSAVAAPKTQPGKPENADYFGLLYRHFQSDEDLLPEDFLLGYWAMSDEKNFQKFKNDDFKLESEKKKILASFKSRIASAPATRLAFEVLLDFGKYNLESKSYAVNSLLNAKGYLNRNGFINRTLDISPPRFERFKGNGDKENLFANYQVILDNAKDLSNIPVAENIARKISAEQGQHSATAVISGPVSKYDNYNRDGLYTGVVVLHVDHIDLYDSASRKTKIGSVDLK